MSGLLKTRGRIFTLIILSAFSFSCAKQLHTDISIEHFKGEAAQAEPANLEKELLLADFSGIEGDPVLLEVYFDPELNPGLPQELLEHKTPDVINKLKYTSLSWIENIDELKLRIRANGIVFHNDEPIREEIVSLDLRDAVTLSVFTGPDRRQDYTIELLCPQSSGLPIFKLDARDGNTVRFKKDEVRINVSILDSGNPEFSFETEGFPAIVRGRGNSTWNMPKKPFRIKFDKKTEVFGLTAAKNWVLLANWLDSSLICNTVTFELGRRLELPFTHNAIHVELFFNDEYLGSYMLSEHKQVAAGRVDISPSKGFLVELDKRDWEDPDETDHKLSTKNYGLPVVVKSPEPEDLGPDGHAFIQNALDALDDAVFNLKTRGAENLYTELIDIESFAKFLMINELVRNYELVGPYSVFMYKPENGKIHMGPLWDFDRAFGFDDSIITRRDYFTSVDENNRLIKFFKDLMDDPVFMAEYRRIWDEYEKEIHSMDLYIDSLADRLERSYYLNKMLWDNTIYWGNEYWSDYPEDYRAVIRDMKDWYIKRVKWLENWF